MSRRSSNRAKRFSAGDVLEIDVRVEQAPVAPSLEAVPVVVTGLVLVLGFCRDDGREICRPGWEQDQRLKGFCVRMADRWLRVSLDEGLCGVAPISEIEET